MLKIVTLFSIYNLKYKYVYILLLFNENSEAIRNLLIDIPYN
jgi:hypothetical protein